jgi:hypothetical protein
MFWIFDNVESLRRLCGLDYDVVASEVADWPIFGHGFPAIGQSADPR